MSQKIFLVRYELEDEVPIDETSEVLRSTYIPDELVNWLDNNSYSCEMKIKEEAGSSPDILVKFISFENCSKNVLPHVENFLLSLVKRANAHISTDEVIVKKELDVDFNDLLIWLKIREVLKDIIEKFPVTENNKVIVG
ncbi:hypothetical protein ACMU9X_000437 [Yersinia enterocolitica]|uniref:hypothetical protein n=1 Tax=Yersinia enterocolitica TaxID=630 RepID=UPI0027E9B267|nr:hypothetical protein [Yersinia enterocolitica]EKN4822382.1 hypothetical protein [Yersinia enterocolitica]EKN6039582.1 hypothetical protein [Yersinia enterocolitica]EKN6294222.1 hypothetical protein [Yersinia enterocolitica]ELW8193680.1 hypothetical protein [Yersinia enterocolitica]